MIEMKPMKNERGKWEVAFRYTTGSLAEVGWAFEPDSPQFDTKAEAVAQMELWRRQEAQDRAAHRRYMYQVEYACGVRD